MTARDNPSALSSSLAAVLAAHTSDFVGVIDEHGVALFMNRSVRGAPADDVEGKALEQFLSPERARRIRAMVEEARASGQPVIDDAVRIDALDGTERWFVEKCVPLREADGALRFLLVRTSSSASNHVGGCGFARCSGKTSSRSTSAARSSAARAWSPSKPIIACILV